MHSFLAASSARYSALPNGC